jgi:hypothetical protein
MLSEFLHEPRVDAVAAKGVADLYLTLVARKLWPGFLKFAADDAAAPKASG